MRAPRVCSCGKVVPSGQKCSCQKARAAAYDKQRGSAAERGYDSKWSKASKAFLALPGNGICVYCGRPSQCVDHIVAHKGDMKLFWRRSNWAPSCLPCNTKKAIRSEGGFGNKPDRKTSE